MKRIGRFTVCGLLGKGGMGKVYKIAYPLTGKIAALKILAPHPFLESLMDMEDLDALFAQEAMTMAKIRHPHVAEILDFDRFGGRPFYIMDYFCNNLGTMIGESYEVERPSRIIHLDKALAYTRQILSGLARLHFAGLIHRDIKPYNILVTDEDQIKICDFGLSKLRNESLTVHRGVKVGSPYYAPPEQEKDPNSVDSSSDLYAVGVMLFRMVTGRLPMPGELLPSRFNSDLDATWDRFILKACDPTPSRRYPDAEAMLSDLEDLEQRWQQKKRNICQAPPGLFDDDDTMPIEPPALRREPLKVPRKDAEKIFGTDALMRPSTYTANRFEPHTEQTLKDGATGRIWQKGGTRFPVTMDQAGAYILQLNEERFAGIDTWRLPTIDELLTLINPPPKDRDYCLSPIFPSYQKWLWSSDRCTFITHWYVNLELGFAGYNDTTSYYHVKAVAG